MQENTAILVGVNVNDAPDFEHSMKELESLAQACGLSVVAVMEQNLSVVNPAMYIGTGKVAEARETAELMEAEYVIFDNSLSPSQLRNLQRELKVTVLDRTNLILEIFERRAKTREARLQVESASLQYMLPRLVGMREALSRQGGSGGGAGGGSGFSNKGAGEKKLELDRRKIEKRISELRKELETMEKDRATQRKARGRNGMPQVALAGYTNAGKSTLMNQMLLKWQGEEGKTVLEKDMLFATLDTTVRRITPGDNRDFLLSDTVGFINHLPHGLVKAFRSTLEEVCRADLILEVVDYSDEHYKDHMQVTQDTLRELGAENIPCIFVMNKADRVMELSELPRVSENRIYMSAKQGVGLDALLDLIQSRIFSGYVDCEFFIPYHQGGVVAYFKENALVREMEYQPEGVRMQVNCAAADADRYCLYLKG